MAAVPLGELEEVVQRFEVANVRLFEFDQPGVARAARQNAAAVDRVNYCLRSFQLLLLGVGLGLDLMEESLAVRGELGEVSDPQAVRQVMVESEVLPGPPEFLDSAELVGQAVLAVHDDPVGRFHVQGDQESVRVGDHDDIPRSSASGDCPLGRARPGKQSVFFSPCLGMPPRGEDGGLLTGVRTCRLRGRHGRRARRRRDEAVATRRNLVRRPARALLA